MRVAPRKMNRKERLFSSTIQRFLLLSGLVAFLFALSFAAVLRGEGRGPAMTLHVTSTAFQPGETIPKKFTCDGPDISPALAWSDAPAETQSFALIMDDPDAPAGTWVHWVLYDLPSNTHELPEGMAKQEQLPNGARQGRNDFRKIGYGGPCPPPGKPHRYFFKLHALDTRLNLKAAATKAEVERAMQGHVLAQGELLGRYGR
jgi:Raf kinase inhibitor-like YbhB/YbcL family protein